MSATRDSLLNETVEDLKSAEPVEVRDSNPFDADALDNDGRPMELWRITYQTAATMSTVPADER